MVADHGARGIPRRGGGRLVLNALRQSSNQLPVNSSPGTVVAESARPLRLVRVGVVALILFALSASTARTAVAPTTTAGRMRPWSVQYMNGVESVTLDTAVSTATSFNVIVALPSVYRSYAADMKAANPNLTLFAYMKGVFTYDTTLPEAAYSHDANGQRIQGKKYPTWLLDPTSSEARSAQVLVARGALKRSGYDGVFLDTLGPAAVSPEYVQSVPINPATGAPWTARAWVHATAHLADYVTNAVGKPAIANGLRDGPNYFDSATYQLLETSMLGAMAEAWLRGATNSITSYPKEATWKQNVDAMVDAGARDKSFLAVTKVWTTGTRAQKDAWYKYAVASFLLANDGKAYLSFSYDNGDATVDYSLNHISLGAPAGPYAKLGGVYQRTFSRGLVLVNPTGSSVTVPLGATYRTLSGTTVQSVTLAPNKAEILKTL